MLYGLSGTTTDGDFGWTVDRDERAIREALELRAVAFDEIRQRLSALRPGRDRDFLVVQTAEQERAFREAGKVVSLAVAEDLRNGALYVRTMVRRAKRREDDTRSRG